MDIVIILKKKNAYLDRGSNLGTFTSVQAERRDPMFKSWYMQNFHFTYYLIKTFWEDLNLPWKDQFV